MSRVLIVDMDIEDSNKMIDIMAEQGWEKASCLTYQESMIFFERFKPDLVVFNNLMPTIYDGRRFINDIRAKSKSVYIIVVSPLKDKNAISDMIELGANDYLVKPIDTALFLWKLKVKFPSISHKEFAKINLPDSTDLTACYFDVKVAIAGISEDYIDLYSTYSLTADTRIKLASKFFSVMGLSFDSMEMKVIEVQKMAEKVGVYTYVSRCQIMDLSPKDEILIRRWLLINRDDL